MLPDVVTFWHGPLDRLRTLCLRSQVAAGHKVTVYSFDPLPRLPEGIVNAEAEAVLPHAFSEKLRPPQPDGSWRDWTTLQFSDFFRMCLMAQGAGLWLDADVLLLRPVGIDPAKPYFAWERRGNGNSALYLPAGCSIVTAFTELMKQDELTPNWLSFRHRAVFAMRRLRGGSQRSPISALQFTARPRRAPAAAGNRACVAEAVLLMRHMPSRDCSSTCRTSA